MTAEICSQSSRHGLVEPVSTYSLDPIDPSRSPAAAWVSPSRVVPSASSTVAELCRCQSGAGAVTVAGLAESGSRAGSPVVARRDLKAKGGFLSADE
jgi:hypothetical protein